MKYNKSYLDLHYALLLVFLCNYLNYFLDISYNCKDNILKLQIVLLEGYSLPKGYNQKLLKLLPNYHIEIEILYISKEAYNKNVGNWKPFSYNWLENVLFSKAEVL